MVSSGSECAVWYRLCRIVHVLISRSAGSMRLWFSSSVSIFLSGWQDGARKGGHILLPVEAGKLGSGSFLQVEVCKSGGRSVLPVAAGKLKS